MTKQTLYLFIIPVLISSACTQKIDGSSVEKMNNSMNKIKSSLSTDKKYKFERSLKFIGRFGLDPENLMTEGADERTVEDFKTKLDGMTADEVIAKGADLEAAFNRRLREVAKREFDAFITGKSTEDTPSIYTSKYLYCVSGRCNFYEYKSDNGWVKTGPYLVHGDKAEILSWEDNGTMAKVKFTNSKGQTTIGWIKLNDLSEVKQLRND